MEEIKALEFCQISKDAVILTVWPSGYSQRELVRKFLEDLQAKIIFEKELDLSWESKLGILSILALYDGEEWLETNCYYYEQPLSQGPPTGAYKGAKWKKELCFQTKDPLYIFVLDTSNPKAKKIWSQKYSFRSLMSKKSGFAGNSCIHLTDDQSNILKKGKVETNWGCNDSYAYHCARCLLNPNSIEVLKKIAKIDLSSPEFKKVWSKYTSWLSSREFKDYKIENNNSILQQIPFEIN